MAAVKGDLIALGVGALIAVVFASLAFALAPPEPPVECAKWESHTTMNPLMGWKLPMTVQRCIEWRRVP